MWIEHSLTRLSSFQALALDPHYKKEYCTLLYVRPQIVEYRVRCHFIFIFIFRDKIMFKSLYIKSDHRVLMKNKEDTSGAQEFEPDYIATVQSNSNIYWFVGIRIHCQWIPTNSYSVTFDYL